MNIEQMYQDTILDFYAHPVAKGLVEPYDVQVHHINTSCGDEITLRMSRLDDGSLSLTWDGVGCSISMSSMSMLADLVGGKSASVFHEALSEFTAVMHGKGAVAGDEALIGEAVAFVGVAKFPARVKCALLGWKAAEDALSTIEGRTDV